MSDGVTQPNAETSLAGTILGSYKIVSELGAGGMGAVWLAEHTLLGSRAAIKVLRSELSQNQGIVQRFFDEARAATRINHPGIVTVLDFGWSESRAFLVMEHLTGETLMRAIYRERMPAQRALALVRQCALAMSAAHAAGIVHRDLKPDNIFVIPDRLSDDRIKILDFGIAKLLGDDSVHHHHTTQTGLIMGTPAYMSPEQCRGAGRVDHRTDVYALGCVLFHMLTGRPPFVADTPGDLIACHLTMAPPVPSALVRDLSPEVDAIVAGCLAKQVGERIATMVDLVIAIDGARAAPIRPSHPIATAPAPVVAAVTAPTKATGSVPALESPPTTMRSLAGEVEDLATRPWRGGAIVGALVLIGAVITIVALLRRDDHATSSEPASAPIDAAMIAPLDAAAADAAIDAKTSTPAKLDAGRPPRPRPPRTRSGSADYDIYDSR